MKTHIPLSFTVLLVVTLSLWGNGGALQAQNSLQVRRDSLRADSLLNLANKWSRIDKHQEALNAAQEAFQIHKHLYGQDNRQTARSRIFVARSLKNLDRFEEALKLYQTSLAFFERSGDAKQIALTHYQISQIYRSYRRLEESRENLSYAIQLLSKDSANNAYWLATFNLGMAFLSNMSNDYESAIPVLDNCKSYYTSLKDSLTLGLIHYHYGNAWYGLQDYQRAKEHFLASYDYLNAQLERDNANFADLLVMLGFCTLKLGDSSTARQYIAEAKTYFEQLDHRDFKYISNLEDLGVFYTEDGQPGLAVQYTEQCFAAVENIFGPRSLRRLRHLPVLGQAYLNNRQFAEAESCYRMALQLVADSLRGNFPDKPRFFEKLAENSFEQGLYTQTLQRCDSAFIASGIARSNAEKITPRRYGRELCQLYGKASYRLYAQTGNIQLLHQAEQSFEKASEILKAEIQDIRVGSSQELLYDRDHPVLEQWLDAEMRLYAETGARSYAEKAFQISGQHKSFLLYDAMRKSGALQFAGLPDSLLNQEQAIRRRIVAYEKSLDDSAFDRPLQDSSKTHIGVVLAEQRKAYDDLLQRMEHEYPEYKQLRFSSANLSLAELQQNWLAPDQGILMYSLTETNAYLFVLTRDTFCVQSFPIDASMVEELDQYRKEITAYFLSNHANDALYDQSLEQYGTMAPLLYQRWLKSVAALLPERVVIIPEGKLCNLPFETLLTAKPKDVSNFQTYPFWAKEKAISYCFSTDLWVEMSKPTRQKAASDWLGIAPFAGQANDLASVSRTGSFFSPLPYSAEELNTLAHLLHGQTWLNQEARPGRFQQEANGFRILHLATHSKADDRNGNDSYLATACTGAPMPAKALYQLSLPAEMVVLSSCESAEGHLNRGEGIIGLVRGFAYAGARSVVASTWLASDQSTAILMKDFYQNLLSGQPKDIALKNARIQFLKQTPEAAHPYFWAGFRLYGKVDALWN